MENLSAIGSMPVHIKTVSTISVGNAVGCGRKRALSCWSNNESGYRESFKQTGGQRLSDTYIHYSCAVNECFKPFTIKQGTGGY